jgi:hypothetical protein
MTVLSAFPQVSPSVATEPHEMGTAVSLPKEPSFADLRSVPDSTSSVKSIRHRVMAQFVMIAFSHGG